MGQKSNGVFALAKRRLAFLGIDELSGTIRQ
jgi:hypothetical protein